MGLFKRTATEPGPLNPCEDVLAPSQVIPHCSAANGHENTGLPHFWETTLVISSDSCPVLAEGGAAGKEGAHSPAFPPSSSIGALLGSSGHLHPGPRDPTGKVLCPTKPSCVHTEECCEKEHTEKHGPEGNCAEAHEEVNKDCKKSREVRVIQSGRATGGPGLIQMLPRRCPLPCVHTHHSPFAQSPHIGVPGHWAPHYSQYGPSCPGDSSSRGPKGSPKIPPHFFSPSQIETADSALLAALWLQVARGG